MNINKNDYQISKELAKSNMDSMIRDIVLMKNDIEMDRVIMPTQFFANLMNNYGNALTRLVLDKQKAGL